jgi:hypothetical protein
MNNFITNVSIFYSSSVGTLEGANFLKTGKNRPLDYLFVLEFFVMLIYFSETFNW